MSSTRRSSTGAGPMSRRSGGAASAPRSAAPASRAAPSASAAAPVAPPSSSRKRRLVNGPEDDGDDDDVEVLPLPARVPAASPAAKRARPSQASAASSNGSIAQLASGSAAAAAATPVSPVASSAHGGAGKGGRRSSAASSSSFSAAATPAVRRGASKPAQSARPAVATGARCTECQSPLNASMQCPDSNCSSNPAPTSSSSSAKKKTAPERRCDGYPCAWLLDEEGHCNNPRCKLNPLYGVQTKEDRERKKEIEAAAEEKQRKIALTKEKAAATAAAPSKAAAAAATPNMAKLAPSAPASAPAPAAAARSSAATAAAAAAPASVMRPSSRGRLRTEQNYVDPFDRDDDEEADPSFRGGGKPSSNSSRPSHAVAAAPATPAAAPASARKAPASALSKVNPRDTDLALAIALSLTEAAPESIAHVATLVTKPDSMYDEQVDRDPRHAATVATGVYVVHPEASTPGGFRSAEQAAAAEEEEAAAAKAAAVAEGEEEEEEEEEEVVKKPASRRGSKVPSVSASASSPIDEAAAPQPSPLPLLHRSGFASSYATESGASVASRARAYASLWPSVRRELLGQIQGQEQREVFDGVLRFVGQSYTDTGAIVGATEVARATAQQIATNIVHPSSSCLSSAPGHLQPFRTHALPVALVHAGLNLEDHPLLMAGLKARIHAREQERKEAVAVRARARRRGERRATASSEQQPKQSYASAYPSHYHRGFSDLKKLDVGREALVDAAAADLDHDSSDDEEQEKEGYRAPAPFVATLPPTPQSLLSLFQSIHTSLLDSYPSPRALASGSSASASGATPRKGGGGGVGGSHTSGTGGDRGGVDWIIESLCTWMGEHRAEQRSRYAQWCKMRTAKEKEKAKQAAAAAAGAAPMDLDDHVGDVANGLERKSNANGRSAAAAATTTAAASSSVPFSPSPVSFPSHIYPRLLLLLPSFDRFPAAILADLLLLLLEHPRLRCAETLLPLAMVWPVGGGDSAVHSLLPRTLLDRIWFARFELAPPARIMQRIVQEVFQARSGSLHMPFLLGTRPINFLLRNFYDSNTSVTTALRVVQYALLDHCDANGGEYATAAPASGEQDDAATGSAVTAAAGTAGSTEDDESERGCPLSATFMRAWMRQLKRSQRISASHADGSAPGGVDVADLLEREDPLDAWVASLTRAELDQLALLPSIRQALAAGSASASSASASASSGGTDDEAESLRARLSDWILDLDAHRLTQWRAAQLFYHLCQTVGFFPPTPSSAAAAAATGAQQQQQQQQGITAELELWMHSLSYPIFRTRDPAAPASVPALQLHPSSLSRFSRPIGGNAGVGRSGTGARISLDGVFLKFEQPDLLRRTLESGLQRHVDEMRAQESAMRARERAVRVEEGPGSDNCSPAVRVLQRAVRNWQGQLDALKAAMDPSNAAAAAAAGRPAPMSSVARSGNKRTEMLHAAAGITAALNQRQGSSAAVLSALRSFVCSALAPLRTRPLGELVTYERKHRLRSLFDAQPEAAVFRALAHSEQYLGAGVDLRVPPAMRGSSSGSSSSSSSFSLLSSSHASPDVCVAFDIFSRVNGLFVNLRDWFDAFKAAMRDAHTHEGDETRAAAATAPAATATTATAKRGVAKRSRAAHANQSGANGTSGAAAAAAVAPSSSSSASPLSDSSLQVRFLTCLTTLANLGYIKPTNRRVDHVYKLTLHRPY